MKNKLSDIIKGSVNNKSRYDIPEIWTNKPIIFYCTVCVLKITHLLREMWSIKQSRSNKSNIWLFLFIPLLSALVLFAMVDDVDCVANVVAAVVVVVVVLNVHVTVNHWRWLGIYLHIPLCVLYLFRKVVSTTNCCWWCCCCCCCCSWWFGIHDWVEQNKNDKN